MSKENSAKKVEANKIISSFVLLVLGILFCLKIAANTISIVIGVALCLLGAINLLFMGKNGKSFASLEGILNSVVIAFGVLFIVEKFLNVFIGIIPYILIVAGFVLILDAFLAKFVRKEGWLYFIAEMVIGIAGVVIGFCLMFVDGFKSGASLSFGVILIVAAIAGLIASISKK